MYIEKEYIDKWFQKILERFDSIERKLAPPPERERRTFNGELLLDNTDLCLMLSVTKRSLQRYRSLGWLPYKKIDQKIYYLESEVDKFITNHFVKHEI